MYGRVGGQAACDRVKKPPMEKALSPATAAAPNSLRHAPLRRGGLGGEKGEKVTEGENERERDGGRERMREREREIVGEMERGKTRIYMYIYV